MSEPGRTVMGASSFSTFAWMAGGKPPGGWPRSPRMRPTTDSGKDTSVSGSSTSARVSPAETMARAMSPTTFEVGVTLMISPNMAFTSA